jgi:hypothetical protein
VDVGTALKIDPREWDDLVRQDDQATFFHTSKWIGLLTSLTRRRQAAYILAWSGGSLVAGVPLIRRIVGGLTVLESMPYGTFGGAVLGHGAPDDVTARLGAVLEDTAHGLGVAAAHVVDLPGRFANGLRGFGRVDDEIQIVHLKDD